MSNQWKFDEDFVEHDIFEIASLMEGDNLVYLSPLLFLIVTKKWDTHKKWSQLHWIFSLKKCTNLKSEKSIKILTKFPLIWYMAGLCRSNFATLF